MDRFDDQLLMRASCTRPSPCPSAPVWLVAVLVLCPPPSPAWFAHAHAHADNGPRAEGLTVHERVRQQVRIFRQRMRELATQLRGLRPPPNSTRPGYCQLQPYATAFSVTRMVRGGAQYKVYQNLLHHNGKWYVLLGPDTPPSAVDLKASANFDLLPLPAHSPKVFVQNLKACFVAGNTLHVDFPFPAFPDNLGHWAEVMLPTYNVLSQPDWSTPTTGSSKVVDRVLLGNLPRAIVSWLVEVLALAVAPALPAGAPAPPRYSTDDLVGYASTHWMAFENVVVMEDRTMPDTLPAGAPPGPFDRPPWTVGFMTPQLADKFRAAARQRAHWPQPAPWHPGTPPDLPKQITLLLYPDGYPPLTNHQELFRTLEEMAEPLGWKVRVTSLTMEALFVSHLAAMAETGILVARHGPLVADALFLPPGALVLELLPYKWDWRNISSLNFNLTQSTGVLHHVAWRPTDPKWCTYETQADRRFHTWTAEECAGRHCLLAHARAGLVADVEAVKHQLLTRMKDLNAGEPVERVRMPWPSL